MSKLTEKSIKIARTAILYLSFFALGLCASVIGPTLLDLQNNVGADTKHIAFIYSSRSGGFLVGSLLGGVLFDLLSKKQPLLICSILTMSACSLAIPWCRSLITLIALMAAGGIAMGILNTGANFWCLHIWCKDGAPFFQALHFFYGVGGFVGPLIAAPFLAKLASEEEEYLSNSSSTTNSFSEMIANGQLNSSEPLKSEFLSNEGHQSLITYAYAIISSFTLFVGLLFFVLFILAPDEGPASEKIKPRNTRHPGMSFTLVIVVLTTMLMCLMAGSEIGFAQMIAAYSVKGHHKLSKAMGSYISSLFWGTFMATRGVSIFLAYKFNTLTLIIFDLTLSTLAGTILVAMGTTSVMWLCIGTGLLGVGLASTLPAIISWMERYLIMNSKIASAFSLTGSVGEMIMPTVISIHLETEPEMFFYVILGPIIVSCVLTIILSVLVNKKGEKYRTDDSTSSKETEILDDCKF